MSFFPFILFVCLGSFCQKKADSLLLIEDLQEIKNEKLDSLVALDSIPEFIKGYLKSKCGKDFEIISQEKYQAKIKKHPFDDAKVLNYFLKSSNYYLIYYWKNGSLYTENVLVIIKYKTATVIESHVLKEIYSNTISELFRQLTKKSYTLASSCE